MNWVDIAIAAIILVSALIGLARGLVREVMSLAVWLGAIGVAYLYHKQVAVALTPYIAQPNVRLGAAFVGLVLAVLILGSVLAAVLTALINKTGLSSLDRLLGFLFGAARGGVVVAMAVFLGALTPLPQEEWWKESKAVSEFKLVGDWLLNLVPSEFQATLKRV